MSTSRIDSEKGFDDMNLQLFEDIDFDFPSITSNPNNNPQDLGNRQPMIVSVKKRRVDDIYDKEQTSASTNVSQTFPPIDKLTWAGILSTCDDFDMDGLDDMISVKNIQEDSDSDSAQSSGFGSSSSSSGSANSNSSLTSSSSLVPDDCRTPFSTRRGKIPRLLKHDLRRFYPAMFINVLNSQNGDLLTRYFERFHLPQSNLKLLPDLATCYTMQPRASASYSGGLVHGRNGVVDYFNVLFESYPDLIFTLQDVELKRCNYSHRCQLILRMKIQWTEMKPTVVTEEQSASTANTANTTNTTNTANTTNTTNTANTTNTTNNTSDTTSSTASAPSDASGCDLPPLMQHEINQVLQSTPSLQMPTTTSAATDEPSSRTPQAKIVWEKYAYEIFADVPFNLDEEWYITQIDSSTLSRSLQKLDI